MHTRYDSNHTQDAKVEGGAREAEAVKRRATPSTIRIIAARKRPAWVCQRETNAMMLEGKISPDTPRMAKKIPNSDTTIDMTSS